MSEHSSPYWSRIRARYSWATEWAQRNDLVRRTLVGCSVIILVVALWVIYRQLRGYEFAAVWAYLADLPVSNVAFAIGLTGLNFGILTGYDAVALRYANTDLSPGRLWLSAFVGYSVSQVAGSPLLTGGSVRYRLYSSWGLDTHTIAKAILFAGVSFWLGFLVLGGVVLLSHPFALPAALDLPVSATILGIGCLLPPLLYASVALFGSHPLKIGAWTVDIPPLWMLPVQIGLAAADLIVAAVVLYLLLPPSASISFVSVLSVYQVALLAGLVSHVPGGLGVFDSIVLAVLAPAIAPPVVFGALLAYRGIFQFLPLVGGGLAFATYELRRL